jgi:tetratricopeptide (TPR) repeat protein
VDSTWENLNEQMRSGNLGTWFLTPFFRRYAPYFRAYAFVLGRANEYAADRFSARITSPQRTAEELILFEIAGAYLAREFWPSFFQSTKTQPQPTESPYTAMRERLRRPWPEEQARLWLERALNRRTNTLDTHPSLTDRLRNLGERPRVPEAMGETAAEYYLQDSLELFTMELTNQWRAHVQDWWKGRYEHLQEQSKKLAELQSKLTVEQPAFDDSWNYALILEDIEGSRAALPAFRNSLALQPDNPEALFAVGRILIDDWQEEGVQLLESAAERNADLIFPATDMLYGYFMATGRHRRAEDYYERAIIQNERLQKAQAERSVVKHTDKFVPHGLTEPQVAELHAFFARVPEILTVYLVQKRVEYFLDKPMFVLGLVLRFAVWIRDRQELLNRLARETPFRHGYLALFDYSGDHRMRAILGKVRGSRVYDQAWWARLRRWLRLTAPGPH